MTSTAENQTFVMKLTSPSIRVIGFFLAFITLWNITKMFVPGVEPWLSETVKEKTGVELFNRGWTPEKRAEKPVEYLKWAERKLASQEIEVQQQLTDIQKELNSLKILKIAHIDKSRITKSYLVESREIYRNHIDASNQNGISFSGRNYENIEIFKQQIELLFNEYQAQKNQTVQINEIEEKLSERYYVLSLQIGKIRLAKSLIGPQIHIAKASRVSADFDSLSENAMKILSDTDRVLQQPVIRTTDDLRVTDHSERNHKETNSLEFQDFISNGI
jgi:hypothetical protein